MHKTWIKFYKNGELNNTLDFDEIDIKVAECVSKLEKAGLKYQDRAIVQMNNSIEAVIYYLALKEMKAIAVPLSPREAKTKIDFVIENCKPKILINEDGSISDLAGGKAEFLDKEIQTIIYTSGTTGIPKGVCLSWNEWKENALSLIEHHKFDEDTILATPLPTYHCNAHGLAMFTTYLAKCQLILFDKVTPNFLEILNKESVNVGSVVPAILFNLVKDHPNHNFWEKFKYFLTAAAPLSTSLLKEILDVWNIKIVQGFGLSESVNFTCTLPIDIDQNSDLYKKIMFPYPSVGVEIPNVKVNLLGAFNEGETGEVLIASPSNFMGYWGNKLEKQKFVNSGDLAYYKIIEGKKYFYLKGRKKEVINRGGEKIFPLELEAEIKSLGILDNFNVISIPEERLGEDVAIVTTDNNFDFDLLNSIPKYRRPKKVFKVKEFFTTSTGKFKRSDMGKYCSDINNSVEIVWQNEKN